MITRWKNKSLWDLPSKVSYTNQHSLIRFLSNFRPERGSDATSISTKYSSVKCEKMKGSKACGSTKQ